MHTWFYPTRPNSGDSGSLALGRSEGRLNWLRKSSPIPPHLAALRERLRPTHLRGPVLPFGDPQVDGCLPGGLPLGQLHEVGADGLESETGALAAGFAAALVARLSPEKPIFWISPVGDLHPPGLLPFGLDPNRLVLVQTDKDADTLAAMETALRPGAAAAVVGEVGRLDRTQSHRLHVACLSHGSTGFVLRRWPHGRKSLDRDATVVATRWQLSTAPSLSEAGGPGLTRWRVALTHARGGRPGEWLMEASDDATHPLRVVATLADHTSKPQRLRHAG